jgi:hypothetical protein
MNTRRIRLFFLFAVFILVITACGGGRAKTPTPEGTFPIDPIFKKYYNQLGGQDVLGQGISPIFSEQNKFYQYVVAGLLMYDPTDRSVSLAPLGPDMGVTENPQSDPAVEGGKYVDGYRIEDRFVPLFDRLGGESVTGKPLTEGHLNANKGRYEQYFENLGMYWLEGDAEDAVHLLAYGDWKCGDRCRNLANTNASIELPSRTPAAFSKVVKGNGLDFTGYALSDPYISQEGRVEQIFENLIMATDIQSSGDVELRPLPELVGKLREAPGAPSPVPGMRFYPIQENLGYNVPLSFDQYIQAHGGYEFVGEPITHVIRPDAQSIEQCYLNMCLKGELNPNGSMKVQPLALGLSYRDIYNPVEGSSSLSNSSELTVQLWESYPLIAPNQDQEIGVVVYSVGKPVPQAPVELTLRMPNGDEQVYALPPTNQQGETRLNLGPISAENGTLVPYRACVQMQNQQKFCVMDSYVIWQSGSEEIKTILPPEKTSYLPFVIKNFHMYVPAFVNRYTTFMPFIGNAP